MAFCDAGLEGVHSALGCWAGARRAAETELCWELPLGISIVRADMGFFALLRMTRCVGAAAARKNTSLFPAIAALHHIIREDVAPGD